MVVYFIYIVLLIFHKRITSITVKKKYISTDNKAYNRMLMMNREETGKIMSYNLKISQDLGCNLVVRICTDLANDSGKLPQIGLLTGAVLNRTTLIKLPCVGVPKISTNLRQSRQKRKYDKCWQLDAQQTESWGSPSLVITDLVFGNVTFSK